MAMFGGLRGKYMGFVCKVMISFHTNPATFSIVHIIIIIIIMIIIIMKIILIIIIII